MSSCLQFMIIGFGSLAASTPYLGLILLAIVGMWIYAAKVRGGLVLAGDSWGGAQKKCRHAQAFCLVCSRAVTRPLPAIAHSRRFAILTPSLCHRPTPSPRLSAIAHPGCAGPGLALR